MDDGQPMDADELAELRTRRARGGRISQQALNRVFATLTARDTTIRRLRAALSDAMVYVEAGATGAALQRMADILKDTEPQLPAPREEP